MTLHRVVPALAAAAAAGCATPREASTPHELEAVPASAAVVVDGRADDTSWSGARELLMALTGAAGPSEVRLRAAVHEDVLYVLATWEDATEDRAHKPWTLTAEGKMASGPEREDVFAIAFPISGEFTADMLAPVECVWDVWQWKSARTDPAGFAMDKSHVHSLTDPGGKRHAAAVGDGRTLYIRRPEDAGASATRSIAAPQPGSAPVAQYVAQTPSGSAADVRAKATWNAGRWTLELARALRTGHPDDADLSGAAEVPVPFAVAILDRAEDDDHATSEVHWLRLAERR